MSLTRMFRHACGPAAVAVAAVLSAASPAHADATVSPTTAYQGAGVNLSFTVTNDSTTAAITAVRLLLPPASPVAEVYPLSVPDWAPSLTYRELNPPMPNPHGSEPIRQTTGSILWTAIAGKAIPPGGTSEVKVAMGPLPESERMQFALEAVYANKATGPALSPVAITLSVPPAAPASTDEALPPEVAAILAEDDQNDGFWATVGWIAILLAAGVGAGLWWRSRRPAGAGTDSAAGTGGETGTDGQTGPDGDPVAGTTGDASTGAPTGGTSTPDGGRAKVTAWSYRDRG